MTFERIWKAMPWVDSHSGNWSLTRSLAIGIAWCVCRYIERVSSINWQTTFTIALIFLAAFSKNVEDFRKGASVLFRRRPSESMPAVSSDPEPRP